MNITTHVLDTSRGRPAGHMSVLLERDDRGTWRRVDQKRTEADGRTGWRVDTPGHYRLTFATGEYFAESFYPSVTVIFRITDPNEDYHVPLLISPFGYSTYRGS